jgi:hypothetical protein
MKTVKTYEGFLDRFREENAGVDLIPEIETTKISGEKIGRIRNLDDLDGKVLLDPDTGLQLYINSMDNYLELIDPDGNDGSGKIIDTYRIPEPGGMSPLDEDDLPNEDGQYDTGVYLNDDLSYLEFSENDTVTNTFSLNNAEDVTNVFNTED